MIKRIITLILQKKTPYTLLHDKELELNSFKVFGCLVYASIFQSQKNKQKTQLEKLLSQNTRHISRFFMLELHFKEFFIFIHTSFHEYIITYHTRNTSPTNNYNLYLTYNSPQPLTHISIHTTPLTIPKQNHTTTQSISSPNYNNNIEPLTFNYIDHILILLKYHPHLNNPIL